jgi:hypothetical protein
MRSNKRFSNLTFTKRVDHEAGRHRTKRAPREPAVCALCGALYFRRRWIAGGMQAVISHDDLRPARIITCPACVQMQGGVPSGYLHVEGAFFGSHHNEIARLLKSEAERAIADNPLGRVMLWRENGHSDLTVSTTTEHLAIRLGHALEKAFDGTLEFDFSHENKLARVNWRRD